MDIIAGITKDEGSNMASLYFEDPLKNFTKDDFIEFVKLTSSTFPNMNLDQVTGFYLKNTNLNDSDAIKWKIFDFYGDILIKCPTYMFAKRYAEQSVPETNVFFYELTYTTNEIYNGQNMGVRHGAEIEFVFGLLLLETNTSETDIEFSKRVVKYWTDFAKYGYELRVNFISTIPKEGGIDRKPRPEF